MAIWAHSRRKTMFASSAIDVIGNTPLIALDRIYTGPGRIVAKAEFQLPGGSVKDRAAKAILLAAREDGRLKPGMPVVEMTSGNMGAGLAVVCAALGHPLVVTMSASNSPARARMLEGLGAEVHLIPQVDGSPGLVSDVEAAARAARVIAKERNGFYIDQFNAAEGIMAHETTTGPEILEQYGRPVDGWVAAVGTGCTFMGVAKALKQVNPATICAAVEPQNARTLAGEPMHVVELMGKHFMSHMVPFQSGALQSNCDTSQLSLPYTEPTQGIPSDFFPSFW